MSERTSARYATMSVSEGKISGLRPVFTDRDHLGKLRLSSKDHGNGVVDYSLESPMVFSRIGISETMTEPLDIDESNWVDVQRGLKKISYPHRVIERMSRSAKTLTHLRSIQHDAGSLSESMLQHDVTWNHMPVYNFGQTRQYAADRLQELDRDVLKTIVEQLFNITISSRMMRKWTPQQWNRRTPVQQQALIDLFHTVLSGEADPYNRLSTQELLDCLMSSELEELEHVAAEQIFERFTVEKDLARNPDDDYGPPDTDIYVRDSDIPPGTGRDKDTTVVLGRHVAPRSKKDPYPRRRVEFWTERPQRVVQPVLRWRRDDSKGESVRSFRFGGGESRLVQGDDDPILSYRSPLMGAAMSAIHFGSDVNYGATLRRHFSVEHLSRAHTGLLPLVLRKNQAAVLDNAYIRQSERLIDTHAD